MTDVASVPVVEQDARSANQVANQANAVTGIYGISGAGKSSLADTGAEYCFATFGKVTLCYAADLGGFGNKRLTLIRNGIMRVYDPRNHINPFETMELISLGAWPVELIDPERGYAAPDAPLILPRRVVYQQYCPQGHPTRRFDSVAVMTASATPCPTCGVVTTVMTASKVDKLIVRHPLFAQVGHRIYDSMSALNDWGLQDLQKQSAEGTLPKTSSGGSLLGAADALQSGTMRFGSSSEGQYGFVQNRTYGWLSNIRAIPDHVLPPTATFFVEISKERKGGGGDVHYGPKIAGTAKTSEIGGWLGNCLHATREPYSDSDSRMVHRLWLRNHIDARDPARLPYIAKHRGTPLGMPDYLEDKPDAEPWSECSLAVFFQKLQAQLDKLDAQTRSRYPNSPGMWRGGAADIEEEVVGGVAPSAGVPQVQQTGIPSVPASITAPSLPPPGAPASPAAQATVIAGGGRRRFTPVSGTNGTAGAGLAPTAPAQEPVSAAVSQTAVAPAPITIETAAPVAAPAAAAQESVAAVAGTTTVPAPAPPTTQQAAPAGNAASSGPAPATTSGSGVEVTPAASPSAPVPAPTPTAPAVPTSRFRRAARPPV